jgi:hypothetical protein
MRERTLQGALTFLGFVISLLAVFYFAMEYLPQVSDWTRMAALVLLGLAFSFLGVYLRDTTVGQPFFEGPRLRWLRPPVVLYLAALLCGIVAEMVFLGIDDVPRPLKILVSLVVGVGLIVAVAWRSRAGPSPPAAPPTP